jgi:hypothetical protein
MNLGFLKIGRYLHQELLDVLLLPFSILLIALAQS